MRGRVKVDTEFQSWKEWYTYWERMEEEEKYKKERILKLQQEVLEDEIF